MWIRSRAKVTAPAKYPGSGSKTLGASALNAPLVYCGHRLPYLWLFPVPSGRTDYDGNLQVRQVPQLSKAFKGIQFYLKHQWEVKLTKKHNNQTIILRNLLQY